MTWVERIAKARARGKFTLEDSWDAHRSWYTCALGEQMAHAPGVVVIVDRPQQERGPADDALHRLGSAFGLAVRDDRFDEAEDLREQIEARFLQLKREHTA